MTSALNATGSPGGSLRSLRQKLVPPLPSVFFAFHGDGFAVAVEREQGVRIDGLLVASNVKNHRASRWHLKFRTRKLFFGPPSYYYANVSSAAWSEAIARE